MPRLKAVQPPKRSKSAKSQLYVDADLAGIIRRVASAEGRLLTPLLNDMVVAYLERRHPDWKLEFEEEGGDPASLPLGPKRVENVVPSNED